MAKPDAEGSAKTPTPQTEPREPKTAPAHPATAHPAASEPPADRRLKRQHLGAVSAAYCAIGQNLNGRNGDGG